MRQTTTAEVRPDEGTIAPSRRQAIDRVLALIAALAICAVLGGISLLVPPFIEDDSASGFEAWHGTLLGALNSVIAPDPANIAQDSVRVSNTLESRSISGSGCNLVIRPAARRRDDAYGGIGVIVLLDRLDICR